MAYEATIAAIPDEIAYTVVPLTVATAELLEAKDGMPTAVEPSVRVTVTEPKKPV